MRVILNAAAIVLEEPPAVGRSMAQKRGILRLLKIAVLGGLAFCAAGARSRTSFAVQASDAEPEHSTTAIEIVCAELTVPCHFLCQDARSKESRAVALETAAKEAREKAEEAREKAVYRENLVDEKVLEAQQSKKRSSNSRSYTAFWKTTYLALKFLVPPYARHNGEPGEMTSSSKIRQAEQAQHTAEDALKAERDANEAWMAADQAMRAATESRTAAVKARASADEARHSFEECLCR